jgi:hypothetical protein
MRHVDAIPLDLVLANPVSDIQTNVQCLASIAAITAAQGYILIPEIVAFYSGGAGPFNLQVQWGPAFISSFIQPVTGNAGFVQFKIDPIPAALTPVQIILPAGGVGIIGMLLALWIIK